MDINIIIFEDNKLLREGLQHLINGTLGYNCLYAFPDCNNIIQQIGLSRPDVILMDIEMPGMNGIEGVKMVKKNFPEIQILMQTVFNDDDKIFDSICAGASGYILKNTPPAKLLEAIFDVFHGGSPMSNSIARRVLEMFKNNSPKKNSEDFNLSVREKEILFHLVNGKSYKMIADECNIGYETVRSHMKNIYEKLHVGSMTEAVAKAIKQKIV